MESNHTSEPAASAGVPAKKKKAKKPWVLKRHRVLTEVLRPFVSLYTHVRYPVRIDKFRGPADRPYLILFNHQTAADQFFLGLAFPRPLYYVATEDLFSNGLSSKLIRFLVNPVPIRKQVTDIGALKAMFQVKNEGGNLCIAPEGNRTYSGRTAYINPSIAQLAKKLKLPVALFRIEGGYGVQPRWSDVVRGGRIKAGVSRVLEPSEISAMTQEELSGIIVKELSVNEDELPGTFPSRRSAEYLERAMYVCPDCGLSEFESHGRILSCRKCGQRIEYTPSKELRGLEKPFPFRTVWEWYCYQNSYVNGIDTRAFTDTPLYTDRANVYQVILYTSKKLLYRNAGIRLFGDRIELVPENGAAVVCRFDTLSALTIIGNNRINIYNGKMIYQLRGSCRFNGLKYLNLFTRAQNLRNGCPEETFLGM